MIREVKPLSPKQWAWLQKRMKEGPTEEQRKKMSEISKRVQRISELAKI